MGNITNFDVDEMIYDLKDTKARQEIAVERGRIDNLAQAPEGSTTGDLELIDLRYGDDGVTYANAGTAVRTQFANVKSDLISNLNIEIADGIYQLEYIESDGTQYFNSGITPSSTLGFEIDFMNLKTLATSSYANLIGSRVASKNNDFEITTYSPSSNQGVFRIGNSDNNAHLKTNERQKITYYNGVYTVDGVKYTIANNITSNSYPIYILALNGAGTTTYPLTARLYGLKLYDGDDLVRDFVPAYRMSDGKVGLYDLVADTFYTNQAASNHPFKYSFSLTATGIDEKFDDANNRIDSINNDISAVESDLKQDIKNITDYNPPFKYMDIDLEMGGYNADGTEQTDTSGIRWRTPDYIYISDMVDTAIVVPTGFSMYACLYGEGNTFKSRSTWGSGSTHNVSANYSIRWTIVKAAWTAMTEAEANCVLIKEKIPWYEYLSNGANPLSEYPDYYDTQIKAVASNFIEDMLSVGANGDGFAFLTDVHWNGNYKHSPSLLYYLKENTNLDLILCGGDLIDRSTSNKASQITDMQNCIKAFKEIGIPFVTAIGNHERNSAGVTDSTLYLSENEVFSITQNPVNWMQLHYSDLSRICFYLDRSATKTRYIFIDSGQNNISDYDITADEITWMTTIINSVNQGWHIIIVVHQLGEYQYLNNPVDENNPFIYTEGAQDMLDVLDGLLENYNIEAIFTGHTHVDNNASTAGGIPIIWTNSDAKWQYHGMTQPSDGTVDAQCFDVVTMDYENKKIYLRRVGRGSDRTITY